MTRYFYVCLQHFSLASPYGCILEPPKKPINKGLSTGSVLVILFFTFAGVYFIGGVVAMKILRGATGWEMLPNHEFWCELPSLVRVSSPCTNVFLIKYVIIPAIILTTMITSVFLFRRTVLFSPLIAVEQTVTKEYKNCAYYK